MVRRPSVVPRAAAFLGVRRLLAAAALLGLPMGVSAQTDEIQVYDASHTGPGAVNLTLHNNFTPRGVAAPAFPGALISDDSLNGVPEWAYGIADWLEAGLYLPLYSIGRREGRQRAAMVNGAKLRLLFTVPHADNRRLFYGVNFEFSYNARHWDPSRITSEVRPIVGWRLGQVDLVVNPILDTAYNGLGRLELSPAARVACNLTKTTAIAIEEYAGFGPLHRFYAGPAQSHQLFALFDRSSKRLSVEAGIGFGLTHASDGVTLKLMLSRDLR